MPYDDSRDLGVKARAVTIDTSCSRLSRQVVFEDKLLTERWKWSKISAQMLAWQTILEPILWPSPLPGRWSPNRRSPNQDVNSIKQHNDHYRHHTISTRTSNFVVEYCCKAKKRNVYRKVVDEHPGDEDFSCGLDFPTLRSSWNPISNARRLIKKMFSFRNAGMVSAVESRHRYPGKFRDSFLAK